MTRRKLAILFAATLAILYSYEIIVAASGDSTISGLHLFGLACALGLLAVEMRSERKD